MYIILYERIIPTYRIQSIDWNHPKDTYDMFLEDGFGEMDDMLCYMPNGNRNSGQDEQSTDQDQLITSRETILDRIHYQEWYHNNSEDCIGEDE